ncbi:hypothetical protein FRC11_001125, partial [Ceratobasidium sp. 423]
AFGRRSTNPASGETETETEKAVTPPRGRPYGSGSSSQRPNVREPSKRLGMLDAGRAGTLMTEAGNRPTSYMSTSSNASSKREMTGRECIKAHKEMILQKRRELRVGLVELIPAFDLEEQPVLDVPVDSEELTLEESFNTQLGNIYSGSYTIDKLVILRTTTLGGLRLLSEMNEYATEIQEIRVQPGSTKAHGKVFVKVRCLQKLWIPIPNSLRSSLALSTTGFISSRLPNDLEPNAMIDQEFEPQRGKLAFSPPIKIRISSTKYGTCPRLQLGNSCLPLHLDQAVPQSAHQYSQETAQASPIATTYIRHGGPPRP